MGNRIVIVSVKESFGFMFWDIQPSRNPDEVDFRIDYFFLRSFHFENLSDPLRGRDPASKIGFFSRSGFYRLRIGIMRIFDCPVLGITQNLNSD